MKTHKRTFSTTNCHSLSNYKCPLFEKKKKSNTEFANGSEPTTTRILIMTNAYYTDYTVSCVEPTLEFQSPFGVVVNFMPNLGVGISGV